MKRRTILLSIIIVFQLLFLSACKKDKDPGNHFTYSGTDYQMAAGILENYGLGDGTGYVFDVTLYSSGISMDLANETLTGTGHMLFLEFFSSESGFLNSGTYTFDTGATGNSGLFSSGLAAIGLNTETLIGTYVFIASGTISVVKGAADYEITVNAKASDNSVVDAYYKGPLTYFDYTGKKK